MSKHTKRTKSKQKDTHAAEKAMMQNLAAQSGGQQLDHPQEGATGLSQYATNFNNPHSAYMPDNEQFDGGYG